jgi:hypothetical protein
LKKLYSLKYNSKIMLILIDKLDQKLK